MNNDGALKDRFCQKGSVQYLNYILCEACLKTRVFTAVVWLINGFATKLFCIFLKAYTLSKTECKKLNANSCNFFFDK